MQGVSVSKKELRVLMSRDYAKTVSANFDAFRRGSKRHVNKLFNSLRDTTEMCQYIRNIIIIIDAGICKFVSNTLQKCSNTFMWCRFNNFNSLTRCFPVLPTEAGIQLCREHNFILSNSNNDLYMKPFAN